MAEVRKKMYHVKISKSLLRFFRNKTLMFSFTVTVVKVPIFTIFPLLFFEINFFMQARYAIPE